MLSMQGYLILGMNPSLIFAMYGQPGFPADYWLVVLAHAVIGIPLITNIMRARRKSGYTSFYTKEGYPFKG